jgi:predicted DNA-binding transcriptional regulator YafY
MYFRYRGGMRAGRLLQVLMLLQAHGRMSAQRLAEETEVSVRTIHRDIEELSASGVPVVAERGAAGGFALMEGWRTRLTGLTPIEAQAVFMAGAPGPAAQLGLGDAAASAQLKLLASLPEAWQADAQRVASRFHLDAVGWYRAPPRVDYLSTVASAVWQERRLAVRYESWKGVADHILEPLGLVLKAGEWYMVAGSSKGIATYKVASIHHVKDTGETFRRPPRFDLQRHWETSLQRFEAGLYRATAVVRASDKGLEGLREISETVRKAIDASKSRPDRKGWRRVTIPIESVGWSAVELTRAGAECEVISPPELRERMAGIASGMARLYK